MHQIFTRSFKKTTAFINKKVSRRLIADVVSSLSGLQLTPEERDARTVFVMQLSQRVRARDIEEFFSSVGKIRDVKLIICNKTRR